MCRDVSPTVRITGDDSALIAVPAKGGPPASGDDRPTLSVHGINTRRLKSGLHAELTFDETFIRAGHDKIWAGTVRRYTAVDRDKLNRIAAEVMEPRGYTLWTSIEGTQIWAKLIRPKNPAVLELTNGEEVEIDVRRFCEADRKRLHHQRWYFNQPLPGFADTDD